MSEAAGRLAGRTALVTGAGRGIGRAIARLFAREGAEVAVVDRDPALAEAVAGEIAAAGGRAFAHDADVSDEAAIEALATAIGRRTDRLHALVNNAGIVRRRHFKRLTRADWDAILDTNFIGAVQCTRSFLPLLRGAAGASVVNIASITVRQEGVRLSAYAASKGALESLTKSLALDLGRDRIRVNYISPGFIRTDMTERYMSKWLFRKYLEYRLPLGRPGDPEDVAKAALFLASPDSDYMTGTGLVVDGGLTLRAI